jgi:hypothetical protein
MAVLAIAAVAWPTAVSACDFYNAYNFVRMPTTKLTLGAGINIQPGDYTYVIPSVDLAFRVGEKGRVGPALGVCRGEGETEITFGGAGAFQVFSQPDNRLSINVQTHLAHASGDGWSETTVPVLGVASFASGERAALFAGAGLQIGHASVKVRGFSTSATDTDPVLLGGVRLPSGNLDLSGALQLKIGDSDTDIALTFAAQIPLNE